MLLIATAVVRRALGNAEEAATLLRQGLERDPLNVLARRYFARLLYYADRLTEAEAEIRQVLELSAGYPVAHYELGRILLAQGAGQRRGRGVRGRGRPGLEDIRPAARVSRAGSRPRKPGLRSAAMLRESTGAEFQIAEAYACLGDVDQAFRWLEAAVASQGSRDHVAARRSVAEGADR